MKVNLIKSQVSFELLEVYSESIVILSDRLEVWVAVVRILILLMDALAADGLIGPGVVVG